MAERVQFPLINFKKSSYIIVEGKEEANGFFIIQRGTVRIFKTVEVVEEEGSHILGPGKVFGVVSAMSSHHYMESAMAITDVTLLLVTRDQFTLFVRDNAPMALEILLQLSQRERFLTESLARLTLKDASSADPGHLYTVGEYYVLQGLFELAYHTYNRFLKYCPQDARVEQVRERMLQIAPHVHHTGQTFTASDSSRTYPKETMIFAEGEPGDEMYIIQKGTVKMSKVANNGEVLLSILKDGAIFGEMALLESKPRPACAVAFEESTILPINRANFEQILSVKPQLITRLVTQMAERIWFLYKQLDNTQFQDPLARLYNTLLIQLERDQVPMDFPSSHTIDFGLRELTDMAGFIQGDGSPALRKLTDNGRIQVLQDKILIADITEISRRAEYFRKVHRIESLKT
ncbi:MAG: Crp/Fnr family transcriptional regulator, partial [Treponema sp.]|nr:Crp/Fnr family transcriptional regulator [Treponema sp.]